MKIICKLFLVAVVCFCSVGTALGAPAFQIDFYDGNTDLVKGQLDTNSNLGLRNGESVMVDILMTGFDASEARGLVGYKLTFDYGLGVGLSGNDPQLNDDLFGSGMGWTIENGMVRDDANNSFSIEGYAPMESDENGNLITPGVDGEDIVLFTFELKMIDEDMTSSLTLWDLDRGKDNENDPDVLLTDNTILDGQLKDGLGLATANVPIPAAVWLFGSGLTGLLAFRRRYSKKS